MLLTSGRTAVSDCSHNSSARLAKILCDLSRCGRSTGTRLEYETVCNMFRGSPRGGTALRRDIDEHRVTPWKQLSMQAPHCVHIENAARFCSSMGLSETREVRIRRESKPLLHMELAKVQKHFIPSHSLREPNSSLCLSLTRNKLRKTIYIFSISRRDVRTLKGGGTESSKAPLREPSRDFHPVCSKSSWHHQVCGWICLRRTF